MTTKHITLAAAVAATLVGAAALAGPDRESRGAPARDLALRPIASIPTSTKPASDTTTTAAEIVAYDARTQRAFAINSTENELAIVDLAPLKTGGTAGVIARLSLNAYGAGLNSVAVHGGWVAVAVEAAPKTNPGKVVFLRTTATDLSGAIAYDVGALPDMLTFTSNGDWLLVANEGEPNSYGAPDSVNPEGSVSILDLRRGVRRATVRTASFAGFNGQADALRAQGIRIYGPGASVAQDLEPEYITTNGRTAWVTLQEANSLAVVDIPSATVTRLVPLGLKNHALPGNGLDPSDRDGGIRIANWPVYGMYQPDAIASFRGPDRQTYLITANEGDARTSGDFPGFNEEVRFSTLPNSVLTPELQALKANDKLGRLNVTNAQLPDADRDGRYDAIHVFGARSFSIWSASGDLVYDSGDFIEQYVAANSPAIFNASNATPAVADDRSDNKGPEPEGVAVGRIAGRTYAFVGLERVGGVMAWDVSDPAAPVFKAYANTREADRGAEGVTFVSANDSPTCRPLVLVGNETSRTVSVYEVLATKPGRTEAVGDDCEREDHDD